MNISHAPVLNSSPVIARPRKRHSAAHLNINSQFSPSPLSMSKINSTASNSKINPSDSFLSGNHLKGHLPNVNSANNIFNPQTHQKPLLSHKNKKDQRRFSLDLKSLPIHTDILTDRSNKIKSGRLKHSSSFRSNMNSADSIGNSPLAFNEFTTGNESDRENDGQVLVIKIMSNWGSSDFLRISSVTVLDDKYLAVPVLKSMTSPDLKIDTKCLFDGHLIKKSVDDLFSVPWCQNHEPFNLVILVSNDVPISGVRIFNSDIATDSSVKDVAIMLDSTTWLNEEIPKNFGIDMKFTQKMREDAVESSRLIEDYFNESREKRFNDRYGYYPLFETKTVYFELLKSWNNEKFFGLNGLQMYDQNNRLISMDDIDDVIIQNYASSNDPSLLFKMDLQTSRPERQFLLTAPPDRLPLIEVIFKEKRFLSRIVIWNYNSYREPLEYGVRNMKISFDDHFVWCGKLHMSAGNEKSADKKIKQIWLTDSSEIKDQSIEM